MRSLIVCLLLMAAWAAKGQDKYKLTGTIADSSSKQKIGYATVTVVDAVSQKVVNGALSDSLGRFEVSELTSGVYRVSINFLGYNKKEIDSLRLTGNKHNYSLGTILLSSGGRALKDVTVTAAAPIIENKIDKMVYNAANDVTSQGGQALDILKKVPQVNVDLDGNVELQGNPNISFLINGKPSSVFGASITDALSNIPASQIKSIEVITSPGAKYDAQGTGGIINIILKESKVQGINGSINLSGGTRLENGSASLNIRHNDLGVNMYVNGNAQLDSRTPATQSRTSYDSATNQYTGLQQQGITDFKRNGYQAGIGMDYKISKYDNLTASFSYNFSQSTSIANTNIQQDTAAAAPTLNSSRYSYSHNDMHSFDWSLIYKRTYEKEHKELDLGYYASYGEPYANYQQLTNYYGIVAPYLGSSSADPGTDRQSNFFLDYTVPATDKVTIETGAKAIIHDIYSAAAVDMLNPTAQQWLSNAGQSYQMSYDQQIYAGYFSASFPLTSFLKMKAGARYEFTHTQVDFPGTTIPDYQIVVPSLILSHDIKPGEFVKLSYTRRIERPGYRDVNPFLNFADPYNISTGNPLLKPEIGNNLELGYNKSLGGSGYIYLAAIERINTQDHKPVTTFYNTYTAGDSVYHNVSVTNTQNVGIEVNTGANLSGGYTVKDKVSLRMNIFYSHRHSIDMPAGFAGADGDRFRVNANTSYMLPKNLVVEVFGNYNSPSNNIQGRMPQQFSYTMAFRKQFWNKKASVGVTATNLFNEYTRQVITLQTPDYTSYSIREIPYRSVGISVSYKFGKLEFKRSEEDKNQNQPENNN